MKSILNKIKEAKVYSNLEVNYDSPMASSQFATKKRAIEELNDLQREYTAKLIEETVAIVVTGDRSKELADIAENTGLATASLDSGVITVLDSLNENMYTNQTLSLDTVMMVDSIVQEVAKGSGIRTNGIDLEKVNQGTFIENKQEFINTCVDLLLESDANVFSLMPMMALSEVAAENEVGKKPGVFPVVLTTNNSKILNSVKNNKLFKKVITVSAGQSDTNNVDYVLEKVDEISVEKTLTAIKKSLKEK